MRQIAVVISNDNKNVTPLETIKAASDAGFKHVFIQWYNKDWQYSQEQQLDYIRQLDLNVIFAHLGYDNMNDIWLNNKAGDALVERYKKDISICRGNNIDEVIMHLISGSHPPMYNEVGLDRVQAIIEHAKKLNVKIALENTMAKGYLEYVLTNIADENLGVCYDSGHCHAHFDDNYNFELFKDRIFAVHLHDNDTTDDQHLLPFDGTLDWELTVKNLKAGGYQGPISLELVYDEGYLKMSPLEFFKQGYAVGEKLAQMFKK